MKTENAEPPVDSFEIRREIEISAPIDIAFQSILDQLGEYGEMPGGKPFPMKFEAWPGGRWFRDLGNNAGHLWGHVQAIKPPTLVEICGPLMMSSPVSNNIQYRLTEEKGVTRLVFRHSSAGVILQEHREGMPKGWEYWLDRIRGLAESKARKGK